MYRVSRLLSRRTKPPHPPLPGAISPSESRTMLAIKAAWASRSFALAAKSNDKVEKKSSGRLSKKDRRVMVESFIKTYQKLNNGSFPSIHVTHKEVGGSYYIVREIVRDIIQENKVLAPPKDLKQERKMYDSPPSDYPFGTISMEPSSALLQNGVQNSDHGAAMSTTGECVIIDLENLTDQNMDNSLYIGLNGSAEKPEELFHEDLDANESLVSGLGDSKEFKIVEKPEEFILTSEKLTENSIDDSLYIGLSAPVEKTEKLYLKDSDANTSLATELDDSKEFKLGDKPEELILKSEKFTEQSIDDSLLNAPVEKPEALVHEGLGVKESLVRGLDDYKELKLVETVEQVELSVGIVSEISAVEVETFPLQAGSEAATSSDTPGLKNLNGTISVSFTESSQKETPMDKYDVFQSTENGKDHLVVNLAEQGANNTKDEAVQSSTDHLVVNLAEQEANNTKDEAVQSSTDHHEDRKTTLDRMNLESWEEISKKPSHEGNPFAGFVKACATAFSKLFSK